MTTKKEANLIDRMSERAGSKTELRNMMGGVPWTTIGRWEKILEEEGYEALPRSAKLAITLAENNLKEKGL